MSVMEVSNSEIRNQRSLDRTLLYGGFATAVIGVWSMEMSLLIVGLLNIVLGNIGWD